MYDILTIGDIKLDTFIVVEEANVMCELKMPGCQLCLEYGKKIPVEDMTTQIAGSAPNVAVGLTKMKRKAFVYSLMGDDILYRLAQDFLSSHGVEPKFVKSVKGKDSSVATVINYKGESTQLVAHRDQMYRLPKRLPGTRWIHLSEQGNGYEKLFQDVIAYKKAHPDVRISFNPGVIQLKEKKSAFMQLLKHTSVLFLNKAETLQVLGEKDGDNMHALSGGLKKLGPEYVVITDGRSGAYAYDGEQLDFAPMFPGERVEATGAGDAFTTGFLGALIDGKTHAEALTWASVNAASVVGEIGPTKGLLTHAEIKRRLKAKPDYKTEEL